MRNQKSSFTLERVRTRHVKYATPEEDLQVALVNALQYLLTKETVFFAVPNGGWRTKSEGARLQAQGVVAGVADLILIHGGKVFGLELKSPVGTMSPDQYHMRQRFGEAGSRVEVARSLTQALNHLRSFGIPLREVEETRKVFAA